MKTAHEKSLADRISTHDELNQVLALLNDPEVFGMSDGSAEPDEENGRRDAVSTLWLDAPTAEVQTDNPGDVHCFPDRPERIN
jgi:hypothetical protein